MDARNATQDAQRMSSVSMAMLVTRLSELAAMVAAGLYALGILRISGELRELHLSTPTVLAGFSSHEVLMKGVGVLMSHVASTVMMALAAAAFVSNGLLEAVNRVVTRAYQPNRVELAAGAIALLVLLLASRYWEGVAYMLLVYAVLAARWYRRQAVGRGLLGALIALGVLCIGLLGSFLAPPPLMTLTARSGSHADRGYLVGTGDKGQWYVAERQGHEYQLAVLGADGERVDDLDVHPATDRTYRTLGFEITDGWLSGGDGD